MNIQLAKFPKTEFNLDAWFRLWDEAGMRPYLDAQRKAEAIYGHVIFEDAIVSDAKEDISILFHPDSQMNRDTDHRPFIWAFIPQSE